MGKRIPSKMGKRPPPAKGERPHLLVAHLSTRPKANHGLDKTAPQQRQDRRLRPNQRLNLLDRSITTRGRIVDAPANVGRPSHLGAEHGVSTGHTRAAGHVHGLVLGGLLSRRGSDRSVGRRIVIYRNRPGRHVAPVEHLLHVGLARK